MKCSANLLFTFLECPLTRHCRGVGAVREKDEGRARMDRKITQRA
jgi:hypothetical protein